RRVLFRSLVGYRAVSLPLLCAILGVPAAPPKSRIGYFRRHAERFGGRSYLISVEWVHDDDRAERLPTKLFGGNNPGACSRHALAMHVRIYVDKLSNAIGTRNNPDEGHDFRPCSPQHHIASV